MTSVALVAAAACSSTGGNRREGRPLVTRVAELRNQVGKQVTLVGTARAAAAAAGRPAAVDLMGGSVEVPEYAWPAGLVDRRVSVTGRIIDAGDGAGGRVYRLGEVESAGSWSR